MNMQESLYPKISIIVPIYNVEKYLDRCISSIINQDFENIEIILVDDASTDNSGKIADSYMYLSEKNIRVFHHESNKGLPSTRKTGLQQARGEYIYYIDADDWIEHNTCSLLYEVIKNDIKDIVYVNFDRVDKKGNQIWTYVYKEKVFFQSEILSYEEKKQLFINESVSFWGKLFRKQWFIDTGIQFMEGASFDEDDIEVLFSLFAKKIGYVDKVLHHWYFEPKSMSNVDGIHYDERLECATYVIQEAKRLKIYEIYKDELDFFLIRNFIIGTIDAIIKSYRFDCYELERLIQYINQMEFNFFNNKYVKEKINQGDSLINLVSKLTTVEEFKKCYYAMYSDFYNNHAIKIEELLKYIEKFKLKCAVWGAGRRTRVFAKCFPNFMNKIDYILDSNPTLNGKILETGNIIIYPYNLEQMPDIILVMCSEWMEDVKSKIKEQSKIFDVEAYLKGEIYLWN